MTDMKKETMVKAEKLHKETTKKAVADIETACKLLGFEADITIALTLSHPDLPDSELIHMTGNTNYPVASIFNKAVKAIEDAFAEQSPIDDLHLMAQLDKKGTLKALEGVVEKMDFLNMIATTAKGMMKSKASPKEVLDELLKSMGANKEERPN